LFHRRAAGVSCSQERGEAPPLYVDRDISLLKNGAKAFTIKPNNGRDIGYLGAHSLLILQK
jgi:hypothetical protein